MSARTAPASTRGEGTWALTAASSVARQRKLPASSPTSMMPRATSSRGMNNTNDATSPSRTAKPSTSTPESRKPIHTSQNTTDRGEHVGRRQIRGPEQRRDAKAIARTC